ncbi:MAG TPA: sulfotransferase [Solirubrobacteraceae bacterium]|jgi:hypothetical protein
MSADRHVSAADETEAPRVLYVMGAGRSGSTILGVALGNHPEVFYAGELDAWLRASGEPNFPGAERARFWSRVRAGAPVDPALAGEEPWRLFEHSLAPFRLRSRSRRRALRGLYRQHAGALYSEIAAVSRRRWVLDSSHYPLRARELRRARRVELYLLYLVRDPAQVIASFSRTDVTNPPKARLLTEAYLHLTHLFSVAVFLTHPRRRRMLVRYEDLADEPQQLLARITDWLGLARETLDLDSLRTGQAFQGNRILERERIGFSVRRHEGGSPGAPLADLTQLPWGLVHDVLRPRL